MSGAASAGDAPLKGRVTTALAEVASLQERVDALMQDVGVGAVALQKETATAPATNTVLDKTALYARYKELLHTKKYEEGAIKDDVATLENDCADLKSKILMLENQVQGGTSLLAKVSEDPTTSLSSRVEAVETDIADFRTRVSSLEQVVAGLQTKAKASLLDVSKRAQLESKAEMGPLAARLSALEGEVDSLEQRTQTMETEIQGGAGVASIAELDTKTPEIHTHVALLEEDGGKEGTIKERTASLESRVATLKSTMSVLENQVSGKTFAGTASLLQVEDSDSGSSLKARITSLEDEVDSLRTRVTTIEHVVTG
jgi:cell division septum initiation protein DivIVA